MRIKATVSTTSRSRNVARVIYASDVKAMYAAANIIRNSVRRALRGGYNTSLGNKAADVMAAQFEAGSTVVPREISVKVGNKWKPVGGGAFVTGNSLNHVTIGEPYYKGARLTIHVGTDLLYNLFWEIGHHNIFTRHYERDERWAPASREAQPAALAAFRRVIVAEHRRAAESGGEKHS